MTLKREENTKVLEDIPPLAPGSGEVFIKEGDSTQWVDHTNHDFAFRHDDDVLWDLTEDEAICFRDCGAERDLLAVNGHSSQLWDDDFAEVNHESYVEMDVVWETVKVNDFSGHESEAEGSLQNHAVLCDEEMQDTTEQDDYGGSKIRARTLSSNMVHYSPDAHAEWFSEGSLEETAESDVQGPLSIGREHDRIPFRSEDDDILFTYEADSNSSSLKFELSVDSGGWANDRVSYEDGMLVPDILRLAAGKETEMDIHPLISSQLEKEKKLSKVPIEIVIVGDPRMDHLEVGSLWKATARSREWIQEQVDTVLDRIRQSTETGIQPVLKMISRSQKVWKYESIFGEEIRNSGNGPNVWHADGTRRFNIYVRILEYCKDLLQKNVTATKREIYYRDVALFKSQRVVDQAIEDLACTFAVQRHCLNMVASSKGLVHGDLRLHMVDGSVVDCLQGGHQGKGYPDVSTRRLVKRLSEIERTHIKTPNVGDLYSPVPWGPDTIMETHQFDHCSPNGPDLDFHDPDSLNIEFQVEVGATDLLAMEGERPAMINDPLEKAFKVGASADSTVDNDVDLVSEAELAELAAAELPGDSVNIESFDVSDSPEGAPVNNRVVEHLPILALVDCDPHGIEIYLCYKFGSKAMAFDSDNLACPTIRWIGLRPRDWVNTEYQIDFNKLLVLTERDRRRALGMLRRGYIKQFTDIRIALSRILFHGRKAEIQAVPPDILTGTYLPRIVAEHIN
ncbi:hypothetical protein SpCBS45565_g01020 [Spizellomyces sp. 'palustris']|nr:hypothetical protein SpCBS45565_g01020 [Spizellomyces sp. 'palustris']